MSALEARSLADLFAGASQSRVGRHRYGRCALGQTNRGDRKRQQIIEFVASRPYSPSLREIGEAVGLSSSSTVYSHIQKLREEGQLAPADKGKPRCIQLATGSDRHPLAKVLELARKVAEETESADAAELVAMLEMGAGL
jgi:SOS-response transcriptional repressor LexA